MTLRSLRNFRPATRYRGVVIRRARPLARITAIVVACFVLCSATVSNAFAQNADENCQGSINYEDADIAAVVDEIALRTGKKFVISPQVNGRITIKSGPNGKLCPNEAWELFQAALRVNSFIATPINGDSYNIVPLQFGARAPGPVGEQGQPGDFITQIVRLQYVDPRGAAASLAQIVSERGVVNPVNGGRSLILVDTAENVDRMLQVLERLDRDTRVYRTVSLTNASASEVATVVRQLGREIGEEGGGGRNQISVVPVDATNSLIVRAEPQLLGRILSVINELDRIGETTSDVAVIRLAHQDAETLAVTLRELADAQPLAPGPEGAALPPNRRRAIISVDKPTNSIIISGDAGIQQTLRRAIFELDVRPAQVQVDAIIVEISETAARQLGVEYLISGSGNGIVPFTTTNFSESQANLIGTAASAFMSPTATSSDDDDPLGLNNDLLELAISSLLGLNGFAAGGAGRIGDDGALYSAIVTAVREDTDTNVLSFPSVVTLDNQPARLQVGQEIPITTGEAVGVDFQNAFRTVTREEVGVILEVTPRISDGDTVTLKLRQETSSVLGQIIDTSTDLITNKRTIETTALVDDGDILVVGGLINQQEDIRESRVPLLGDIPIAGNLFKNTGRSLDRSNLMVFIRPTIIRDQTTAREATSKKLEYIRARGLLRDGSTVSEMERIINQATGVRPIEPGNLRPVVPSRQNISDDTQPLSPPPLSEGPPPAQLEPASTLRETGE